MHVTTSIPLIVVTGSTGQLGGRVAARLAALGQPQRLLVRDPARAPQLPDAEVIQAAYEDGPSMRVAFSGVQTLFLVSGWGPLVWSNTTAPSMLRSLLGSSASSTLLSC